MSEDLARCGTGMSAFHVELPMRFGSEIDLLV
ncbi:hypothetical protein WSK_3913 [Novosphingobium sp. Rr 2-17]|nr:hypothetical protein WSK_3913 [Novosphingobium sp. Rr 2-17]